jgi:mannose-6-phosphate isomerase-like protein (cupin superfamily)
MSRVFDLDAIVEQAVRPNITRAVFGKTLLDDQIKVVLTRVAPGGKFETHRDSYAHLFYFLSGQGRGWIGDQEFVARAGIVAQIDAGELHSYENTGDTDLVLISLNIPKAM